MAPVIEIHDLSFSFNGHPVLSGVELSIEAQDFVAVIGPNGGGKTTLIKLMLGLYQPDSGWIRILGQEPKRACRRIGYMPQYATGEKGFPIRVLDVVLMGRISGTSLGICWGRRDRQKAMECLELVGMADARDRLVGSLSGGQLQRVLLARALVSEPEILFLDEPMANIDMGGQGILFDLLAELNRKMTILLVTHDIGLISRHIKSIVCVNERVFFHNAAELKPEMLETLGLSGESCPVEMIAHGVPHRVLKRHNADTDGRRQEKRDESYQSRRGQR